jgi:hypothetical protein
LTLVSNEVLDYETDEKLEGAEFQEQDRNEVIVNIHIEEVEAVNAVKVPKRTFPRMKLNTDEMARSTTPMTNSLMYIFWNSWCSHWRK